MSISEFGLPAEVARRGEVLARVISFIRDNRRIALPDFDGSGSAGQFALQALPDNDFSGTVGEYRYQLEGEEDLLHLVVARQDGGPISVDEGRRVAAFLFPSVSPAVIWLKPGELSQHFYLGHDELLPILGP